MGHQVDTLSYEDLYPKGQNLYDKVFGPIFRVDFKVFKEKCLKYDVIDANFGVCSLPKKHLILREYYYVQASGSTRCMKKSRYKKYWTIIKIIQNQKMNI
jgi:hypothetical protein